jgi:hypothetical protein
MLSERLGTLMADFNVGGTQMRLRTAGSIGGLPLLWMTANGDRLGSRDSVAYAHPAPRASPLPRRAAPFDLLVVDESFTRSGEVIASAWRAGRAASCEVNVVKFNSNNEPGLSDGVLIDALEGSARALVFCHVATRPDRALETALLTGASSRFTAERLARLRLGALEELHLVCCSSGASNPFIGDHTMAHAAGSAGADRILFTFWSVTAKLGAWLVGQVCAGFAAGSSAEETLASLYATHPLKAAPFAFMRS